MFADGKIEPKWIDYRGRKITVVKVNDYWETKIGGELIRHYLVSDGKASYELMYNWETLRWTFARVANQAECG
ncbi:hypothetical protein [Geotalea sp. SG265]|uniref:hypothetical protein n=1 Tax=Geotalea sp. SG265 TaxID=2922867 RepID=UPI001FAEA788|nr:hypothetical protein [Geotalea sp. SG265]